MKRLWPWIIALLLTWLLATYLMFSCVSVRVVIGEENEYEGQTKSTKGVESTINERDSINQK